MLFGAIVLTRVVKMSCLVVMMRGAVMVSASLMVVFALLVPYKNLISFRILCFSNGAMWIVKCRTSHRSRAPICRFRF